MPDYDRSAVRAALPLLRDRVYLNTGTEGILNDHVLAAYQAAIARQEQEGHVALEWRNGEIERARDAVAGLLHTQPETIAFTRNATDGHNLVLHGLRWRPGDELLISDQEHPALSHPAAYLRSRGGPAVRVFEFDADPQQTVQNIRAALTPKTRLIAYSHVSCESGVRLPAREISEIAHAFGTLVLLDGAQSLGAVPVNVTEIDCDFFVSNGHKWLCGPKETGILYVRQNRLDDLELSAVGAGTYASFAWRDEEFDFALKPDARRFEFGTRNQAALTGLRNAISWLEELGFANVYAHIRRTARAAKQILGQSPGVKVLTPMAESNSAGLVTFHVAGKDQGRVSRELWERGIITRPTARPSGVRASAAYFTTEEDFERLAAALRETQ